MKQILAHTWQILTPNERRRFIGWIIADFLLSLADIFSIAALLWMVNFYLSPPGKVSAFLPSFLNNNESPALGVCCLSLFVLKTIGSAMITGRWYRFAAEVAVRISRQNLQAYQFAGMNEYIHTDSSVHIRKIAFQPFEFCQYILMALPQIVTQAALVLLTILAILLFNSQLFLLLLAILLPPVAGLFYFVRQRLHQSKEKIKIHNELSLQHLLDALKGYVETNLFGRHSFFLDRFTRMRRQFSNSVFQSMNIQTLPTRIIELFAVAGLLLLLAMAKWKGEAEPGFLINIGAFVGAAYKIIPGMVKLINLSGQARAHAYVAKEILQSQQSQGAPLEKNNRLSISGLSVHQLGFRYGDKSILKDLSFSLTRGDLLIISGHSGRGKTTLAHLLTGLLIPAEGHIDIVTEVREAAAPAACWPEIAYVKQQPFLFHDTILRNIILSEESPDEERLRCAIEGAGLGPVLTQWPLGLQQVITENGKNLSGGQRQRIALARALYTSARVMVMDEPFSELDTASEEMLLLHLRQLADSGRIIVLITHNPSSLRFATQTINLDESS